MQTCCGSNSNSIPWIFCCYFTTGSTCLPQKFYVTTALPPEIAQTVNWLTPIFNLLKPTQVKLHHYVILIKSKQLFLIVYLPHFSFVLCFVLFFVTVTGWLWHLLISSVCLAIRLSNSCQDKRMHSKALCTKKYFTSNYDIGIVRNPELIHAFLFSSRGS